MVMVGLEVMVVMEVKGGRFLMMHMIHLTRLKVEDIMQHNIIHALDRHLNTLSNLKSCNCHNFRNIVNIKMS